MSLAAQLAELSRVRPTDHDPEADPFGDAASLPRFGRPTEERDGAVIFGGKTEREGGVFGGKTEREGGVFGGRTEREGGVFGGKGDGGELGRRRRMRSRLRDGLRERFEREGEYAGEIARRFEEEDHTEDQRDTAFFGGKTEKEIEEQSEGEIDAPKVGFSSKDLYGSDVSEYDEDESDDEDSDDSGSSTTSNRKEKKKKKKQEQEEEGVEEEEMNTIKITSDSKPSMVGESDATLHLKTLCSFSLKSRIAMQKVMALSNSILPSSSGALALLTDPTVSSSMIAADDGSEKDKKKKKRAREGIDPKEAKEISSRLKVANTSMANFLADAVEVWDRSVPSAPCAERARKRAKKEKKPVQEDNIISGKYGDGVVARIFVDNTSTTSFSSSPSSSSSSSSSRLGVSKKELGRMWEELSERYEAWLPSRDAALNEWATRLIGGNANQEGGGKRRKKDATPMTPSSFKAISKSFADQVRDVLEDPRSVVSRSSVRKAGPASTLSARVHVIGACGSASFDKDNKDGNNPNKSIGDYREDGEEEDPGIYDDTDLYERLLRDYIQTEEAFSSGGKVSNSMNPAEMSRRAIALKKLIPKRRKVVDRRASKGRKVRYNIHDKIVGFMPPALPDDNRDSIADAVFANLFGIRVNLDAVRAAEEIVPQGDGAPSLF